jgi:hypothetical protein
VLFIIKAVGSGGGVIISICIRKTHRARKCNSNSDLFFSQPPEYWFTSDGLDYESLAKSHCIVSFATGCGY